MEINHENGGTVYIDGRSRTEDLMPLMCQGQGMRQGISDIAYILGDDIENWETLFSDFTTIFRGLKDYTEYPIRETRTCYQPGTYVCITKQGKIVVAKASKNSDGKIIWDKEVRLFFPKMGQLCFDLLEDNNLISWDNSSTEESTNIPSIKWRTVEEVTAKRTEDGDCVTTEPLLVKGWINDDDFRIVEANCMVNRKMLCIPVKELWDKLPKKK